MSCPICGFDRLSEELVDDVIQAPYGPEIPVKLHSQSCSNCGESGDFECLNTPIIDAAMAESARQSVAPMIKAIHEGGYSNTAAERVLQLPFGTFQKWLDQPDQLDAASLAMLRLIAQHPGILAASEKS